MQPLTGSQKKYLRGLAHGQKPVVFIGQNGLSESVVKAAIESLDHHELIKVKCIDFKEKELKKELMIKPASGRLSFTEQIMQPKILFGKTVSLEEVLDARRYPPT